MPGTWHKSEQLGYGIQEVNGLWYEEEHQCLGEVTENGDHGKRHSRKIAKRITNKHLRWTPTMNSKRLISDKTFIDALSRSESHGEKNQVTANQKLNQGPLIQTPVCNSPSYSFIRKGP